MGKADGVTTITKRELVIEVASKLGLTQNEVSNVVQDMLDTITEALVNGQRLEVRNFGVFEVKKRDARIGRNPRTGQEVPISEKRVASFKPGKALKEWVQAGVDHKPVHLFDGGDGRAEEGAGGEKSVGGGTQGAVSSTDGGENPQGAAGSAQDESTPGEQRTLF